MPETISEVDEVDARFADWRTLLATFPEELKCYERDPLIRACVTEWCINGTGQLHGLTVFIIAAMAKRHAEIIESSTRTMFLAPNYVVTAHPVEHLRAALQPFAEFAEEHGPEFPDSCPMLLAFTGQPGQSPTLGDCRRAAGVVKSAQ